MVRNFFEKPRVLYGIKPVYFVFNSFCQAILIRPLKVINPNPTTSLNSCNGLFGIKSVKAIISINRLEIQIKIRMIRIGFFMIVVFIINRLAYLFD